MKHIHLYSLVLLIIGGMGLYIAYAGHAHRQEMQRVENARIILISKQEMKLRLIDYRGNELLCAPVATGKNYGNKRKKGDMRTPEGVFQVSDIQDASGWMHDFGDGKGEISGAYGNHFIRLSVPGQKGIGIHGTHLPESIGTRASEGCIRMHNEDLERLVKLIYPPLVVVITPAKEDVKADLALKGDEDMQQL